MAKGTKKKRVSVSPAVSTQPIVDDSGLPPRLKRGANVYDAVARRISTSGFINAGGRYSQYQDYNLMNSNPSHPEEVLLRITGAPKDIEEDEYFANDQLSASQPLPDSDVLKAIHTYASDYYYCATNNRGVRDWHSMDGTALLAMGILLEEAARESLGETGDMVFVEGEEVDEAVPLSIRPFETGGHKRLKSAATIEAESLEQSLRSKKRQNRSSVSPEVSH